MAEYESPEWHPAFEEYCETIFELNEDDFDVIQARIAERLDVSRPAVSEMVKRMEAEGLIEAGRQITLTEAGRDLAETVVRRHRLAERFLTDPGAEIGDVLLDQRLAAGIGNVYKCEALFVCGVDPHAPLGSVAPETRRRLYETAALQLQSNLGRDRRVTFGDGLAVYGRHRQGCRACGTGLRSASSGVHGRQTWWCPKCQAPVV